MNGEQFLKLLREFYRYNGQPLSGNYAFYDWHKNDNETYSFRFNLPDQPPMAIPQNIIISAWDANIQIYDDWLQQNFDLIFNNDFRLQMLNHLIQTYNHLR